MSQGAVSEFRSTSVRTLRITSATDTTSLQARRDEHDESYDERRCGGREGLPREGLHRVRGYYFGALRAS